MPIITFHLTQLNQKDEDKRQVFYNPKNKDFAIQAISTFSSCSIEEACPDFSILDQKLHASKHLVKKFWICD